MKGERIYVKDLVEIGRRLREEREEGVKLRLIFLNLVGNWGFGFEAACKAMLIGISTGYDWVKRWNEEGYEGLKDREGERGRKPKLSEDDLSRLREQLKGKAYWTTKEVRQLILEMFGVSVSEDTVVGILRDKFKMNFSKPYLVDYRRPENAEAILKQRLESVLRQIAAQGLKEQDMAIGFLDEASPQNTANTVKVWSFGKVKAVKNTTHFKSNTIGFYALRGHGTKNFLPDSKAPSICQFLAEIKAANPGYKAIIVVLDNSKSHISQTVKEKAAELGIYLVFLPTYSPDLNPIEYIWKSIRRVV